MERYSARRINLRAGRNRLRRRRGRQSWLLNPRGSFVTGGSSNPPGTGGSGTGSTGGSSSGSSGSTATSSSVVCCADSGITGSVEAPAPASFGASPLPAQIATSGGPTFDSKSGSYPPGNVCRFSPIEQFAVHVERLSAVSTNQSATVTVIGTSGIGSTLQLIVPSINLDTTWSQDGNLPGTIEGATYGLSYVVLGEWKQSRPRHSYGAQCDGVRVRIRNSAGAMPTTGQADFSGHAQGSIYAPVASVGGHIVRADLNGNAAFSADFASGKITGAFTHMQYPNPLGGLPLTALPWNDVSVNASIAAGTNRFSGSTAVTSAPQNTFSLLGSATGHIDGAFYGPAAQNLGAIWSLTDGTTSAIGGVAAGH